jgi:hypothetical protein
VLALSRVSLSRTPPGPELMLRQVLDVLAPLAPIGPVFLLVALFSGVLVLVLRSPR